MISFAKFAPSDRTARRSWAVTAHQREEKLLQIAADALFIQGLFGHGAENSAVVNENVVRGQQVQLRKNVAGEDHGHALLLQGEDMLAEFMDGGGIETILRFVQHQQLGTTQLHCSDGDPLKFAGG